MKKEKGYIILLSLDDNSYCFSKDDFKYFLEKEKKIKFSQREYKINKSVMQKYDCFQYCDINELKLKICS